MKSKNLEKDESNGEDTGARSDLLPVVGIGASAGGLAAIRDFFQHMPDDSGLAFVVVVHLSPEHESHLADLLQPYTTMPVEQVNKTLAMEANRIYVIPPGANLSAIDTHLRLTDLEELRRQRAPIDHFFRTLSESHHETAVGVILTGTGSDGTVGLRRIRQRGGLTIVQDPNEAEYDGMPQSAISSGIVDLVLPLAEMPEHIIRFATTEPAIPVPTDDQELDEVAGRAVRTILALVRAQTGHDFSRYKRSTIMRRIRRRMQMNHLEELEDYLDYLHRVPDEGKSLFDDLLITVTNFFRDTETFEKLEEEIIPPLFEGKTGKDRVRVWSVGCATDEEAYSLAILLLEQAERLEDPPEVQVFATDIHEPSLRCAREGFYPESLEVDVTPERLERFFVPEDGGYRIRQEVREAVVFASHNLMKDPPFSRVDLITCRNVLIYLQRDVQQDVISLFHYALRPDAYLVLGSSESVERTDVFQPIDKKHCIFRRRNVPAPDARLPVFPMAGARRTHGASMPTGMYAPPVSSQPVSYGTIHQKMVERYAPPSILVNESNGVVHFSQRAGNYLVHPGGDPTSNLFKLVREPLRLEVRAGLHAARERGEFFRSRAIPLEVDGKQKNVIVRVQPAADDELENFFLVIFDEIEESARSQEGSPEGATRAADELEEELELTRNRLQSIIEQYESSQEEMKASNEELLSMNEEMRSTMEELETSKEELQSINEELATLNQENRHKVEELSQLSGDLQNLLAATDIATLFLDRNLRIMRYTPPVALLFNIRSSDKGRPVADLTHRLGYEDLIEDAHAVLERLVPVSREIASENGQCFVMQIRPYRSSDDRIDGVVMTFVDITEQKSREVELREAQQHLSIAIDAAGLGTWHLDLSSGKATTSLSHDQIFGYEEPVGEWSRDHFRRHVIPADRPKVDEAFSRAAETGKFEIEVRTRPPQGGIRWVSASGRAAFDEEGVPVRMAGVNVDITERKQTEAALQQSEERFRLIVECAEEFAIFTLDPKGNIVSWNPGAERILGYKEDEIIGESFAVIFADEDREAGVPKAELEMAARDGEAPDVRWHTKKDGTRFWADGVTVALRDDDDKLRGFAKLMQDETERKIAEEALRASEQRYLFDSMDQGFCVIELIFDHDDKPVDYRFVETNPAFERHTGLVDAVGRTARELVPDLEMHWYETYGEVALTGRPTRFTNEVRDLGKWFDTYAFRLSDDTSNPVALLFTDITPQRNTLLQLEDLNRYLEERVEKRTRQVRQLASTLSLAEQAERRRIARVLHDDLQQLLFGVHLRLEYIAGDLGNGDNAQLLSDFTEARGWLAEAIEATRHLAVDLNPPVLKDEGLGEALNWLQSQMLQKHHLSIELDIEADVTIPEENLRSLLFQSVRELLFNVVKHAQVGEAAVAVSRIDGEVRIDVRDAGVGFNIDEAEGGDSNQTGLGLFSVRERIRLIGGKVEIESSPGAGTRVTIMAPT